MGTQTTTRAKQIWAVHLPSLITPRPVTEPEAPRRATLVAAVAVATAATTTRHTSRRVVPRTRRQQLLGRLSLQWRLWWLVNAIQHRQQDSNFNLSSAPRLLVRDMINNNLFRQLQRPPAPRLDSIECRSGDFSRLDSIEHRAPKGATHIHVGLRPPHEPSARVTGTCVLELI